MDGIGASLSLNVEEHLAVAAAEGLFLPRLAVRFNVTMLGAGLPGEKYHFLGANAVGVDVGQKFKTYLAHAAEAEIGYLDARLLFLGEDDGGLFIVRKRVTHASGVFLSFHISSLLGYCFSSASISARLRIPLTESAADRLQAAAAEANSRMRRSSKPQ